MKIFFSRTGRGFVLGEFEDDFGESCSIQESSADPLDRIWLGCNKSCEGTVGNRMLLTREIADTLADVLRHFADTGVLGEN